jgi:hypothetical protein
MHRLTPSEAGAEIAALINSRASSPRQDEIEAIIAKAMTTPAATPTLSSEHLAYRKIVAEIERCNDDPDMPDEETDAALSRLQEQASELEAEIWAKPAKTLADVAARLAQNARPALERIRLGTNGRPRSASMRRYRADAIPRRRLAWR